MQMGTGGPLEVNPGALRSSLWTAHCKRSDTVGTTSLAQLADLTGVQIVSNQKDILENIEEKGKTSHDTDYDNKTRQIPLLGQHYLISYIDSVHDGAKSTISPLNYIQISNDLESIRYRPHLIAIELSQENNDMQPTLHPGDYAIIDINDCIPQTEPGNIYLVQKPDSSLAFIKRVKNQRKHNQDFLILYCDSPNIGPEIFNLNEDFQDKITNCIKGKVVASLCNMSRK